MTSFYRVVVQQIFAQPIRAVDSLRMREIRSVLSKHTIQKYEREFLSRKHLFPKPNVFDNAPVIDLFKGTTFVTLKITRCLTQRQMHGIISLDKGYRIKTLL